MGDHKNVSIVKPDCNCLFYSTFGLMWLSKTELTCLYGAVESDLSRAYSERCETITTKYQSLCSSCNWLCLIYQIKISTEKNICKIVFFSFINGL